jgi:glycopeptide antibiotics resistance protein
MSSDEAFEPKANRWRRKTALFLLISGGIGLTVMPQCLYPTEHPTTNLRPFDSIIRDCTVGSRRDFIVNFLGNILAFIPMGAMLETAELPKLRGRSTVVALALFSLVLELGQYLSGRRYADIDDLILNTLGAAIGVVLARFVASRV